MTPDANVAINCELSGLVVLDIDERHGGFDILHELIKDLGKLPITVESLSGGGGQHIFFQNPGGSFRRELGPGIDIKCSGYVVAPPSIHPSGKPYLWDEDPEEVEVAELPTPWIEKMRTKRRLVIPEFNDESDDPLRWISAKVYATELTGRWVDRDGWMQCPFHRGGQERSPSFRVDGTLWCCYACEPLEEQSARGGNIYSLAAALWGYEMPLDRVDFRRVRDRLLEMFP